MDLKSFLHSELFAMLTTASDDGDPIRIFTSAGVFDGVPELPLRKGFASVHTRVGIGRLTDGEWNRVILNNLRLHAYRITRSTEEGIEVEKRTDVPTLHLPASTVTAMVHHSAPAENTWY